MTSPSLFLILVALLGASGALASTAATDLVTRVDGGKLILKTGEQLATGATDVNPIAVLEPREGGSPYLLLSGKPEGSDPSETFILMVRKDGQRRTQFVYPGKIVDPKNGAVLFEARAFYGKCSQSYGDIYVVFQKERIDRRRHLQESVFLAEPGKEMLREKLFETSRRISHLGVKPNLTAALRLVHAKSCFEISGRNRKMLAKPLDLNPTRDDLDSEEDDQPDQEADPESLKKAE